MNVKSMRETLSDMRLTNEQKTTARNCTKFQPSWKRAGQNNKLPAYTGATEVTTTTITMTTADRDKGEIKTKWIIHHIRIRYDSFRFGILNWRCRVIHCIQMCFSVSVCVCQGINQNQLRFYSAYYLSFCFVFSDNRQTKRPENKSQNTDFMSTSSLLWVCGLLLRFFLFFVVFASLRFLFPCLSSSVVALPHLAAYLATENRLFFHPHMLWGDFRVLFNNFMSISIFFKLKKRQESTSRDS